MQETSKESTGITQLLLAWRDGDPQAFDRLAPVVYDELRRLAHTYMQDEPDGHLLQTTALVHEAYMRLVGLDLDWHGKGHFMAVAATMMRRILVDYARRHRAAKRGNGVLHLTMDEVQLAEEAEPSILALDRALTELSAMDPRKGRILELRYFGGMSNPEIASHLEISLTTVERDLRGAKAWLGQQLAGAGQPSPAAQMVPRA